MDKKTNQKSEATAEWYKVGWVKSAHGIKGELYIQLLSKKAEWLSDMKSFRLKPLPGSSVEPMTFSFKRVKPHKLGLIVLPEGFNNRNQSELWKGADFLIDRSIFETKEDETPYLVEFEGFEVFDVNLGLIGHVRGFMDNGAQDLLIVQKFESEEEIWIPFVDAFIVEMDKAAGVIKMDLPEGLVDAN